MLIHLLGEHCVSSRPQTPCCALIFPDRTRWRIGAGATTMNFVSNRYERPWLCYQPCYANVECILMGCCTKILHRYSFLVMVSNKSSRSKMLCSSSSHKTNTISLSFSLGSIIMIFISIVQSPRSIWLRNFPGLKIVFMKDILVKFPILQNLNDISDCSFIEASLRLLIWDQRMQYIILWELIKWARNQNLLLKRT